MRAKLFFLTILLLTIFLRIWRLDAIPPSLNWDEVSLGFNSYSILRTGHDEWGNFLPLSFRAYGDYKLPGYVYLDVPFIAIFGLNELGVRLPSAILGVGMVIFIYLILRKITRESVALWGMFLASTIPWLIIISRIGLEANLALFLTTGAVLAFLYGLQKRFYLPLSAILLGLSIFSYNTSRVVAPLLLILAAVFFKEELGKKKKEAITALAVFLIFFIVAAPIAILSDSSARYKWVAILDQGAILQINNLRGSSQLSAPFNKLIYNKVTYFTTHLAGNYLAHFNPSFLFTEGGSNYQFSIPGSGLLYLVTLPLLLVGTWRFLKERKSWQLFLLGWLVVAPIPAAITRDSPHALRSLMMIPPLMMIAAVGLDYLLGKIGNKKVVNAGIAAAFFISFYLFWKNYTGDYIKNYSWSWQYGYKQVVDYIKHEDNHYQRIYLTKKYGEPHEFVLFYLGYDPQKYRDDPNLIRYFRSDWYWVDRFNKFYFVNDWEVKESVKCKVQSVKCLLITSPGNYPRNSQLVKTIYFLDGKPAFDIVELAQVQ